jgi:hypothetical protein
MKMPPDRLLPLVLPLPEDSIVQLLLSGSRLHHVAAAAVVAAFIVALRTKQI